jgi:hypothetical protein
MSCGCKNGNTELPNNENKTISISIKEYITRTLLFIILVPFIIPITIGMFFYIIVIKSGNLDSFSLMKVIVKILKNALKDDYNTEDDEIDDEDEINEDNYELDEIINEENVRNN